MNRTVLASILTLAIVTVPYGAWFITGISKIDQDAQRNLLDVEQEARVEAGALAAQLSVRLEAIRRRENERPFYHYQNLYHDPRGAHEGVSIVPSPLAQGPTDPLIAVHFQVDGEHQVTLPTINDEIPEATTARDVETQRAWRQRLLSATVQSPAAPSDTTSDMLPASVWRQIRDANAIYRALRRGEHPRVTGSDDDTVAITYTSLAWRTVLTEGEAELASLRWVTTPAGRVTQGFIIPRQRAQEWFGADRRTSLPVKIRVGRPQRGEVSAGVIGTPWRVAVLVDDAMRDAISTRQDERDAFLFRFIASAGAALIGAGCIIYLMRQTERMARERSRFAASAAHELRTPLAGLQMYGEMLAEGLGDPAKYREYANRIVDEAQRLGRVVSNVLGFARMERGALQVKPEPGGLGPVVREYIEQNRHVYDKTGVTIDLDIAKDVPTVRFDRDAIVQVLQNLLDNAEKYSRGSANRTIEVTLEAIRPTSGLSGAATGARLTVRDHGPGVDAALLKRLFDPFRRGDRADAPAGIGLGLTITHALVKSHRGTLTVDNAPDGGAVFKVSLPV